MTAMAFVGVQPSVMGWAPALTSGSPQALRPPFLARGSQSAGARVGGQGGRGWLIACAAVSARILKKRGRDPQRPRRPLSACLQYFIQNMKKIAGNSIPEKAKKAAKTYASMSAQDRKPYEKKAADAFNKYSKDMDKYRSSGRLETWTRDPARPRLPLHAYTRFVKEQFKQNSGTTFKEVAAEWGEADKKKKAALSKAYASDMTKYEKAMESYRASGKEAKWKAEVGIKAIEDAEAAIKQKAKEKAQAKKERARARNEATKQKEKEKAQAKRERVRAREEAKRERAKREIAKAKALAIRQKEKEKEKAKREREKVKAAAAKEKERARKQKAKVLEAKLKSAAKAKAKNMAKSRATA